MSGRPRWRSAQSGSACPSPHRSTESGRLATPGLAVKVFKVGESWSGKHYEKRISIFT